VNWWENEQIRRMMCRGAGEEAGAVLSTGEGGLPILNFITRHSYKGQKILLIIGYKNGMEML
jgi:hypothetical protein